LTVLACIYTECVKVARLIPGWLSGVTAGWWGAQSSQGPGCGRRHSPGVVPTIPCGIGSVHKSVDRSLIPVKITFPLNITLHFSLSNITLHPALHRGRMPMRDAIVNDGTMCLVNIVGRPGILISHTCVDWIFLLSGKLMVRGDTRIRLLSTMAPSMMKMEVVPVSAIAWLAAIVRALRNCGIGLPQSALTIAAIEDDALVVCTGFVDVQLEVITVAVSSSSYDEVLIWVGSTELAVAEMK
jgi:hypothetical protein